MNEQINIFSKYAPVDIAVMCAKKGMDRADCREFVNAWKSLELAHDFNPRGLRELAAIDLPSDDEYKDLSGAAADLLVYIGVIEDDYDAFYGPAAELAKGIISYLEVPAARPETASADLFSQFSETDIAYAAVLKGLDYKEAIRVWGDIVADQIEETPRNSLHSLGSLLDTFRLEINLKEGIAKEVALYFLKHLGLIK